MNRFALLLEKITEDSQRCLRSVCELPGSELPEISAEAKIGPVEPHLRHLQELGLVEHLPDNEGWIPTWLGQGVRNWAVQLEMCQMYDQADVPEPTDQENGNQIGPPCNDYRPLQFAPGYCWCGRFRTDHAGEVAKKAEQFLAWDGEQKRRQRLWERGSGRKFSAIYQGLREPARAVLQQIHQERAEGISLGQLVERFTGQLKYAEIQATVNELEELELVLANENRSYWSPTWDGTGVSNWAAEWALHKQLNHPMPEPRPDENGFDGPKLACDHYRALLREPGFCWCGHSQAEHDLDFTTR